MNVTEHTESLYSILDTSTRSWWYHRELRGRGEHQEARRRERADIRGNIRVLRECLENHGFATNGRGGWTIRYREHSTLSRRYPGVDQPMMRACVLVGIPVLDSTTIPDDLIWETTKYPMAGIHPDPEPPGGYGFMHHAPVSHVFKLYESLGATIHNWDTLVHWAEMDQRQSMEEAND